MKRSGKYFADLLLLMTALIWGVSFYFQKLAAETTSPCLFNAIRYLIAAAEIFLLAKCRLPFRGEGRKVTLLAGTILFIAATLQQVGIATASIANTSFITSVYIVLVPFISALFFHRTVRTAHWIAALISLAGLYLISTGGEGLSRITAGDLIVFAGSIFWALHILAVEKGAAVCDPIRFSAGQFLVAGVLHTLAWLIFGHADASGIGQSWPYGVISGVVVIGLAYTLQAIAQKNTGETEASVILGLESVFGALSGAILYHEQFTVIRAAGMVLIFAAVLLAVLKE